MTGARCGSLFLGDRHGICPDAIAFGKTFHVAGVIVQLKKKNGYPFWPCPVSNLGGLKTTLGLKSNYALLSSRVKFFKQDNFFNRQLAIGTRIMDGVNTMRKNSACGLGCLISLEEEYFKSTVTYSFGRLLPLSDLSDAEIDIFLSKISLIQ